MAIPDNNSSVTPPAAPVRPSWETARPAPAPRPAPTLQRPAPAPAPTYVPSAAPAPTYAPPAAAAYQAPAYQPPTDLEGDVKYDFAGNPIPSSGTDGLNGSLPGQLGYSAGIAAGTWPPAPISPYGGGGQNSENGTDRVARLKWNWGAFLIPFWWSIFNGQRGIAVAIFLLNGLDRVIPSPYDWGVTIASIGIGIYLGAMGHRLAWSSERFGGDYDHFIRTQRAWMIWGFILAGLIVFAVVALAVLVPSVFSSISGAPSTHHHYNTYGNGNNYGNRGNYSSGNSQNSGQ